MYRHRQYLIQYNGLTSGKAEESHKWDVSNLKMLSIQPLRPIILSLGTRMAYVGFSGDHSPVAAPSLFRDQNYSSLDVGLWLRVLFATYLHIPPEAAKGRDLVIVEPVTCFPGALKNALMAAAFNCLQVGSVAFVEGMVMAATAAGIDAGLVIDLGWRDIVVGEVSEGRTGDTYCAGVGMRNVDAWIEEQLKTEDMGETLRAECCLALHCDTQGQPNGLAHGIEIPGRIRSDAITVLFDCEDRLSERNICETICRALRNASVAKRSILIRNIVFVGAGAMIPGFASRLSQVSY